MSRLFLPGPGDPDGLPKGALLVDILVAEDGRAKRLLPGRLSIL